MFVVELLAGIKSNSLSLTGDSLDMLGDAIVYGSTIFVISWWHCSPTRFAFCFFHLTRTTISTCHQYGYVLGMTSSPIPDLVVGSLLTLLFAKTAFTVLSNSWRMLSLKS